MTEHHFFFPKKKFNLPHFRAVRVSLCEGHHQAFNNFYDENCLGKVTDCSACRFSGFCFYYVSPKLKKKWEMEDD
jgi:hypothetical protein